MPSCVVGGEARAPWRHAVRADRNVATVLEDPAPAAVVGKLEIDGVPGLVRQEDGRKEQTARTRRLVERTCRTLYGRAVPELARERENPLLRVICRRHMSVGVCLAVTDLLEDERRHVLRR